MKHHGPRTIAEAFAPFEITSRGIGYCGRSISHESRTRDFRCYTSRAWVSDRVVTDRPPFFKDVRRCEMRCSIRVTVGTPSGFVVMGGQGQGVDEWCAVAAAARRTLKAFAKAGIEPGWRGLLEYAATLEAIRPARRRQK